MRSRQCGLSYHTRNVGVRASSIISVLRYYLHFSYIKSENKNYKNCSLKYFVTGPPPRPLEAARPEHLRCRAFHPSEDVFRTFQRKQAEMWQLDHDDFTSTQKFLKEAGVYYDLRAPACACVRPADKRQKHLCISNKCTSFRSIWTAPWQLKYLHDHTERKNLYTEC